jgi:hypothetical protein
MKSGNPAGHTSVKNFGPVGEILEIIERIDDALAVFVGVIRSVNALRSSGFQLSF